MRGRSLSEALHSHDDHLASPPRRPQIFASTVPGRPPNLLDGLPKISRKGRAKERERSFKARDSGAPTRGGLTRAQPFLCSIVPRTGPEQGPNKPPRSIPKKPRPSPQVVPQAPLSVGGFERFLWQPPASPSGTSLALRRASRGMGRLRGPNMAPRGPQRAQDEPQPGMTSKMAQGSTTWLKIANESLRKTPRSHDDRLLRPQDGSKKAQDSS